MQRIEGHALRVGVLGVPSGAELGAVLGRLGAALPRGPAAPLLRLVCLAGPAPPAVPGWTLCPVAGPPGAAADLIARNADVLLAVGGPAGALADPVAAALVGGIPVLVLADGAMRLLTHRLWAVSTQPPPEGEAAWSALQEGLAVLLTPPASPMPPSLGLIEAGVRLPGRVLWRAHRTVLELLARSPESGAGVMAALPWWSTLYGPADALATAYADRYRSSYTIVLALAAVALVAAVIGLRSEYHWPVAISEMLCLLGILALVWANTSLAWRTRLIQCRLLAELCRKQAALAFVGRSLPAARIAGLAREGGLDWIGWKFAAAVRAAPLPAAAPEGSLLPSARDAAASVLLRGQRAYHEARVTLGQRRESRLVRAGSTVFGLTVVFVLVKIGLLATGVDGAEGAGLVAALFPAVAAALFGFRAYAEIELLVQQSEHLIGVLDVAEDNLGRIDTEAAGAARAIGDVFEETAVEMLADVAGWIQISRVKAVEAG